MLEDIGDHFLIGRAEQHFAFVAVTNAEHFLAVIIIAPAFAPQLRRLDGRHQDFLRPGAVLFFTHNLFNAAQHAQARRQPGIDARRGLANQPRTQHEAVRGDLRLGRGFLESRQKGASEAQGSNPLILSRWGPHPNPEEVFGESPDRTRNKVTPNYCAAHQIVISGWFMAFLCLQLSVTNI